MKKIIALLLALVMVFALVACGAKEPTADEEKTPTTEQTPATENTPSGEEPSGEDQGIDASHLGPIKIGHICDLTGIEALTGAQAQAYMDYAVKYVGPICGREIQLIHKDSQSSPSAAVDAARTLIEEDGVDLIIGPNLIGHKAAVANFAAGAGVPILFYSGTPIGMLKAGAGWVLSVTGSTMQLPTAMADYTYKELGYDKVVTLTKDDSGGKAYMDPFTQNFTALGGEVLAQAWTPTDDSTDYAAYLMALADHIGEADCLVAWTSAGSAIQLWQAWYQLGMHETLPVVACFHGSFTDSFLMDELEKINPDLVDAIIGTPAPMTWAYNLESQENADFLAAYKADHNGELPIGNNLPGSTISALLLVKAAVEKLEGETSDHEALLAAMKESEVYGPEGYFSFQDDTGAATKDIYVVKVCEMEDGSYNYELAKKYEAVPSSGVPVS